jgi:hypothetical protein
VSTTTLLFGTWDVPTHHVLAMCDSFEVIGVDAAGLSTEVVDHKAGRNGATDQRVDDAMGRVFPVVDGDPPIPEAIMGAAPFPVVVSNNKLVQYAARLTGGQIWHYVNDYSSARPGDAFRLSLHL